jgi:hypothetical protein
MMSAIGMAPGKGASLFNRDALADAYGTANIKEISHVLRVGMPP